MDGETVVLGYKAWEVGLSIKPPPVDPSLCIRMLDDHIELEKRPMCTSLGVHVDGAVNFWPDTSSQHSGMLGMMKRIATDMPQHDESVMNEFLTFSFKFLFEHFQDCVLLPETDLGVSTWLEGTNYPQGRKRELLEVSETFVELLSKHLDVMCHVKHEPYKEPKYSRGIYSRSDIFKTYFGPICALIGKAMFHKPWFVKYLNVDERISRMRELFDNEYLRMFTNDFTSFEATFKPALMVLELFFFFMCTQHLPIHDEFMDVLFKIKLGKNRLVFRSFMAWLQSKRYSGEMDTSLSNSIVNLCFMLFLLHKSGHDEDFYINKFPPQIEGDDSIGAYIYPIDPTILQKLGAKAKIELFDSYNEASFCGVLFGSGDGSVLKDPINTLLNFGYAHFKYIGCSQKTRKKLLRAKSLSLLYSYPGCPILKSLAAYGLRVTSDIDNKHAIYRMLKGTSNYYERQLWINLLSQSFSTLLDRPIHTSSRDMMFKKFLISVPEQLELERYLDSLDAIQPLSHPLILEHAGTARVDHYHSHVSVIPHKRKAPSEQLTGSGKK